MKLFRLMFLLFLIGLLSFGCAKKSGIEGKVIDGKGQPIVGIKIIAKQVQPIKGYEQFDSKTSSDGSFSFRGVYPTAEYIIKVEGAMAIEEKVQSGPEGQIIMLPSPIEIRFLISKDGFITDSKTGLQWVQDAGQKMNWFEVNDYVHNLKIGSYSDWRLPSKEELESLTNYAMSNKGVEEGIIDIFNKLGFKNVQSGSYWLSTTYASGITSDVSKHFYYYYVWPVRSGQ